MLVYIDYDPNGILFRTESKGMFGNTKRKKILERISLRFHAYFEEFQADHMQ